MFFDKKKPTPPQDFIPVDFVHQLAMQGKSEQEMIGILRSRGFSPLQVDRALREALKNQVEAQPTRSAPIETPTMEMIPAPRQQEPMQRQYQEAPRPQPRQEVETESRPVERTQMPPPPRALKEADFTFEQKQPEQMPFTEEITLEEIIEGVVDEKWQDFEEKLNSFERKDIQLQQQIDDVRKRITELEKSIKERETQLLNNFSDVSETLDTIQGRIGSVEKVFKDFVPELSENVKTISDLVGKMKEKS